MKHTFIILTLCFAIPIFAQPNYKNYNSFLKKYVTESGKVSYKKIKKSEVADLAKEFQTAPPQKNWSKNEQLAYWINTYNLFTIKLIVDNYPVKKITDLDNGKTWDVKRIEINGQKYSLNDIENVIIRPTFKDARIHFALNCAAKSCPPLYNSAFLPSNMQSLLEQRTKSFVNSRENTISEQKLKVSKIFDWYKGDFSKKELINKDNQNPNYELLIFLSKYTNVKFNKNAIVEFSDYDWNLNE